MSERKKTSWVWTYFVALDNKAQCKLCDARVCYKGGSTGALVRHLQSIHKKVDGAAATSPKTKAQQDVSSYFTKPMPRDEYVAITNEAAKMCAIHIRPLDMVEGQGFREFWNALHPSYEVNVNLLRLQCF